MPGNISGNVVVSRVDVTLRGVQGHIQDHRREPGGRELPQHPFISIRPRLSGDDGEPRLLQLLS